MTETVGGRTRRCDRRCYDGRGKRCRCICQGRNHGVGLQRALEQTRELASDALAADLGLDAEPATHTGSVVTWHA